MQAFQKPIDSEHPFFGNYAGSFPPANPLSLTDLSRFFILGSLISKQDNISWTKIAKLLITYSSNLVTLTNGHHAHAFVDLLPSGRHCGRYSYISGS